MMQTDRAEVTVHTITDRQIHELRESVAGDFYVAVMLRFVCDVALGNADLASSARELCAKALNHRLGTKLISNRGASDPRVLPTGFMINNLPVDFGPHANECGELVIPAQGAAIFVYEGGVWKVSRVLP